MSVFENMIIQQQLLKKQCIMRIITNSRRNVYLSDGNWLTIQSYYPTQTVDIFNKLLVAPKANDGHASPSIDRNLRRKYAAQIAGNGVSGLQISKIFRWGMPPDPPSYAWFRSHGQF